MVRHVLYCIRMHVANICTQTSEQLASLNKNKKCSHLTEYVSIFLLVCH